MRILVAPDKFKGTLTAADVARVLAQPLSAAGHRVETVPIADGGDGTVAAAVAHGFTEHTMDVAGPLGTPVAAAWATRREPEGGMTAIVELAEASGLSRLPAAPDSRTALEATTAGTGQLIAAALDAGATTVVLGVGGSATTDGGRGMLEALGWPDRLDPRLSGPHTSAHIVLASDVTNPLLGPTGAAAVFGPQKGAGAAQVAQLEERLAGLAADVDPDGRWVDVPGAGAAGGAGFAALAALGAESRPGAEYVMDLVGLTEALEHADFVITGEGSFDGQSLDGKGPGAVLDRCADAGIPAAVVAGASPLDAAAHPALRAVFRFTDYADLDTCLGNPQAVLATLADDLAARLRPDGTVAGPTAGPPEDSTGPAVGNARHGADD